VLVVGPNEIHATTPAMPAGTLNDVSVTNPEGVVQRPSATATLSEGWMADFADVPQAHQFHDHIEKIFRNGITAGCGDGNYCLNDSVRRDQMAVLLLKGMHGASFSPPSCTSPGRFLDVACPGQYTDWVEELATENITGGCGDGNFCPDRPVTRA